MRLCRIIDSVGRHKTERFLVEYICGPDTLFKREVFIVLDAKGKYNVQNGVKGIGFLMVLGGFSSMRLGKESICV